MIYKDMKILKFGYNKVAKAFKVLVEYPIDKNLKCFNVKWREGDTEWTFTERIYQGAIFLYNAGMWLSAEGIWLLDLTVLANEYKDEYYFILKLGNGEPRKYSFMNAKSTDTQENIVNRVQKIKYSFENEKIWEKRRKFTNYYKSFLGG